METTDWSSENFAELKNQRRVCKDLKTFTDVNNNPYILAADMMFASSKMDGKVKLIAQNSLAQQFESATVNRPA